MEEVYDPFTRDGNKQDKASWQGTLNYYPKLTPLVPL
jgi:hypothetical protein